MKRIAVLVLLAALVISYQWWQKRDTLTAQLNTHGFVDIGSKPQGIKADVVLIMTAPNCPSDIAKRAEQLFQELSEENIPVIRSSQIAFEFTEPSSEQTAGIKRFNQLIKRGSPIIILGSHAAANPRITQIIAQYRSLQAL